MNIASLSFFFFNKAFFTHQRIFYCNFSFAHFLVSIWNSFPLLFPPTDNANSKQTTKSRKGRPEPPVCLSLSVVAFEECAFCRELCFDVRDVAVLLRVVCDEALELALVPSTHTRRRSRVLALALLQLPRFQRRSLLFELLLAGHKLDRRRKERGNR